MNPKDRGLRENIWDTFFATPSRHPWSWWNLMEKNKKGRHVWTDVFFTMFCQDVWPTPPVNRYYSFHHCLALLFCFTFLFNLCRKLFGPIFFWVGYIFGSKKIGSKKIWVKKKLGRKFGLAKFYFGLMRFILLFVMLLITTKLNNNNMSLCGGWWVLTNNVVKPTFTKLWLSWVLTTF